jgi:GH25 family lysozyme M1 (1,4-beta-N-acetylmuramidase)
MTTMAQTVEMPISGEATATVKVNLRQGAPSVQAPVLRKLNAQTTIAVTALVVGDNVQGNPHWYRTSESAYAWAGAFTALDFADTATPAPAPAPAPAPPSGVKLNQIPLVVDLYHGDGVASFEQAFAAGLRGIIHKATTGATGVDDAYAARRDAALNAGLLWGAYHWGTAAPAADQVTNFLNHAFLNPAAPDKNTLVALDFETDLGNQMTVDGAREFLNILDSKLNRKAVLYSGDVAKSGLGTTVDKFFGSHRLWLAQYGSNPSVQRSWKTYWLWQYTDGSPNAPGRKTVPGIPGDRQNRLDCNYFAGTADDLKTQWAS